MATLEEVGVLTHTSRLKAPLSTTGLTKVNRYLLYEPFAKYTIEDILNGGVITASLYGRYSGPPTGR